MRSTPLFNSLRILVALVVLWGAAQASFQWDDAAAAGESSGDAWWDPGWPFRVAVEAPASGVVETSPDFGALFAAAGQNHALLDLRSLRVVPYTNGQPGAPLPYAESYSTLLEDAENPQIGWNDSGVYWTVNDGYAEGDLTRASAGSGSLKAVVENLPGGYGYPGVELRIATGEPLSDWSRFEAFIYSVWPEVNASAQDQAPDLYWFKMYNACGGSSVTQGGPPLALDRWNPVSVSLNPLDACWPQDGLNLSAITRMEFHTRDNETVNGNSGLWDDGDVLTLWFDDLRLVDQNQGTLRWESVPGVSRYYVYFDTLQHEGHPLPELDPTLAQAASVIPAPAGPPEAGGYYHQVAGAALPAGLEVWAAPTIEKITPHMATPVAAAPLRIGAARGEFEPWQLVVRSATAQTLAVSAGPLTHQNGGGSLPAPALHRVEYVDITSAGDSFDRFGAWPDPLWPLENGAAVSFPAGENAPLWFTLQVPWDAAPGLYHGTVLIGAAAIPVEVTVWDFSLPRTIHLDSEWGFGWSSIVETYRGTAGGSVQDCYWDVVESFKQDFADHRLIPKGAAWPAGLNYPGGIEYDCAGNLDPDAWGEWDFATLGGRYVHGEDGFNDGYGFPAFLAFGPQSNWPPDSLPSSFCGETRDGVLGSSAYQEAWSQYLGALDAYITPAGYAEAAYYHIVNEPQTFDDYTISGQISALTESAAPHLRQMISEQVEPTIYNYPGAKIDIWMPTISNYEVVKSQARQKDHGEEVWWYYLYGDDPPLPNPILMSHPGIEARLTPWLAWAERVDGLLHYSATDWSPNPWDSPNVTGKDNGDGFFFYPPHRDGSPLDTCGENGHRLVPSIRWENLRDGMEDYEYLWLLAGGDPQAGVENAADAFVAQIADSRTRFSRVPTDLAATRETLAHALEGPAATKTAFPAAVEVGGEVQFGLTYTHPAASPAASLTVTDALPTGLTLKGADTDTGEVTLDFENQTAVFTAAVQPGETVRMSVYAQAGTAAGTFANTAIFESTGVFSATASVAIFTQAVYLPVLKK